MKDYLVTYDDGSTLIVRAKNKKDAEQKAIKADKMRNRIYSIEDLYL